MICPMCSRPLKSPKSIAKGIGPVCARKLENLKDNADDDQLKMELDKDAKNVLQGIPKAQEA
ncbi:DUF6011 domain-containing protein [Robertmurraya massiliosenegalensis]|uniref:DUF6011 domain-containing protein n=1 Tax=Robertmurraya TaxID=2837507 RepID=UPI0039A4A50C